MVAQQNDKRIERFLPVSGETAGVAQPCLETILKSRHKLPAVGLICGNRFVAASRKRSYVVEKRADPVNDLGAAYFVVALAALRPAGLRNRVRAIERVV